MLVFSVLLIAQALLACGEILSPNWKQLVQSFPMSTDTFSGDQNCQSYGHILEYFPFCTIFWDFYQLQMLLSVNFDPLTKCQYLLESYIQAVSNETSLPPAFYRSCLCFLELYLCHWQNYKVHPNYEQGVKHLKQKLFQTPQANKG